MAKSLIITEKPSVARDITNALGGFVAKDNGEYYESEDFLCSYAVGHIFGLLAPEDIDPKYKRWRLADLPILPEKFQLKPLEKQKGRIKVLEKLFKRKDVDTVVNACDAAREGELIFREIMNYFECDKPIKRLWLQSMVKAAIKEGFKKLANGTAFDGLAAAASCRSYSDWLIGMNSTRALTVRLKSKSERGSSWSAGRVQTPTLAILVKRELEVLSHIPLPYKKIEATFKSGEHEYKGLWVDPKFKRNDEKEELKEDRIFDLKLVDKILKDIAGQPAKASETRKPKPRKAPMLFDLTSLQREANRRFGWPAARTLRAAQRCYESHKVLTYPRTSSRVLPNDYVEVVDKLLETISDDATYGRHAKYLIDKGRKNDALIFNDAGVSDHFAIIPTGEIRDLEGDDKRLFDLVTRTFLASFYPPAIYEDVVRTTVVKEYEFKSHPPMVLKEAGWQAVFEKDMEKEDAKTFPPLIPGKDQASDVAVDFKDAVAQDFQTKPPPRIGEAGLLSLMQNAGKQVDDEELAQALQKAEGLGTAATRADIIENLKLREYVDATLRPTVKGIRLIDILERIKAGTITSPELTAKLELNLSEVEDGKRTAKDFMQQIEKVAVEVVEATRNFEFEKIYPDKDPLGKCPNCKAEVFERAWFYGCTEASKRADEKKACEFLIWKDHSGRYLDRQTVAILLAKGETGELDGFKTQNGKTYKAVLKIENNQLVRKPVEGSEQDDETFSNIEVNAEPLGKCPLHKDKDCIVVETKTEFVCQTTLKEKEGGNRPPVGFSFPRFLCKREIKREEVVEYIKGGVTNYLTGFKSKKGRPFSARLRMQPNGGFVFEFPESPRKKKKDDATANDKEAAQE